MKEIIVINSRVDRNFKDKLDYLCEKKGLSIAFLIREALIQFINNDIPTELPPRKKTIEILYTPNYPGATPVKRSEDFKTPGAAQEFLNRMQKMYPDTKQI